MFGLTKGPSQKDQDREIEIEKAKSQLRKMVHDLSDMTPEDIERSNKHIKEWCGKDKLIPLDFKQRAMKHAQKVERAANMLYCDTQLHHATEAAINEHHKEKMVFLGNARRYFGKATSLGADDDWRKAFKRAEENLMMTGGVHKEGPSRAKPADIAPRAPNRAKGE